MNISPLNLVRNCLETYEKEASKENQKALKNLIRDFFNTRVKIEEAIDPSIESLIERLEAIKPKYAERCKALFSENVVAAYTANGSCKIVFAANQNLLNENLQLASRIIEVSKTAAFPELVDDSIVEKDVRVWNELLTLDDILSGVIIADSPLLHLKMTQDIKGCDVAQQNEVTDYLWIGNAESLHFIDPMVGDNPLEFTRVITLASDPSIYDRFDIPEAIERLTLTMSDNENGWAQLEPHLEKAFDMIDKARIEEKPILVHCKEGTSRSAALVLAYLLAKTNVTLEQARIYLKFVRFTVNPKPCFMQKLEEYASKLK